MDALLNLEMKGLPNSEYVFLNAQTGTYLYHSDESLLNTETTDPGYQEIIRRIKEENSTQTGTYFYQDENNINQLAVYKYLQDREGRELMIMEGAIRRLGNLELSADRGLEAPNPIELVTSAQGHLINDGSGLFRKFLFVCLSSCQTLIWQSSQEILENSCNFVY